MAFGIGNIIAVVMLVAGVVLLVLGFQEYGAFASKITRALGKSPSNEVLAYFIGGGLCAAIGAIKLIRK